MSVHSLLFSCSSTFHFPFSYMFVCFPFFVSICPSTVHFEFCVHPFSIFISKSIFYIFFICPSPFGFLFSTCPFFYHFPLFLFICPSTSRFLFSMSICFPFSIFHLCINCLFSILGPSIFQLQYDHSLSIFNEPFCTSSVRSFT